MADRYLADGPAGLAERSPAPLEHPNQVAPEVEEKIVELRRAHPTWGPRKLRAHLIELDLNEPEALRTDWPARSTFANILSRHGLAATRRRRKPTFPSNPTLTQPEAANDVWAMDFKGWFRCGDGARCDPFTLMDLSSRYLLRCVAMPKLDTETVQGVLEAAFRQHGLPRVLRIDNGPPFASPCLAGMSRLSLWLVKLGIKPKRIDKGKPQQNGCLERLHRTLKAECAKPPLRTLRQQQQRFAAWRREYNEERPHQALEDRTPASGYQRSERRFPRKLAQFDYPPGTELRWVCRGGTSYWRNAILDFGKAYAEEYVAFRHLNDPDHRYMRVFFRQQPLAWFDEWNRVFAWPSLAKQLEEEYGQGEDWHW